MDKIDNLFLTMEGLGQYLIYVWLTHPNGGNIRKDVAIEGVRRKRKSWSQDEGFALFLILDQLLEPKKWVKQMFGNKVESIINLVHREI